MITNAGCWENTQKACKSLAFGSWFTSFSRVLPTSRVSYHAGKPIESVVYCLNRHARYRRPDLKRAFLDFLSSPPLPWPLVKGRIRQIPIGHFQVLNTFTFKGRQNLSSDNDFNLHLFFISTASHLASGHPPFFSLSAKCVSWYWVGQSGWKEKPKKKHKKSRNRRPR